MEENDDDDVIGGALCMICNDFGKSENWYCCSICRNWAHAACTGFTPLEAKRKAYVCDFSDIWKGFFFFIWRRSWRWRVD
jgi:hypothetical protein